MEKVLIHRDKKKVKQAQDFFDRSVLFLQQVNDQFVKIGISLEFDQLIEIVETLTKPQEETTWFCDTLSKMYKKNTGYSLPVTDNTLNQIKVYIIKMYPVGLGVYRFEPNLMYLSDGKILPKPNAREKIEDRFSFYAENERGAALAGKIYQLANAANDLNDYLISQGIMFSAYGQDIPGLEFIGGQYRADISFIRNQERISTTIRTKPNTRTMNLDVA